MSRASLLVQLDRLRRGDRAGALVLPDGRSLEVTHLDRVVFPATGATKGELLRYYLRVAPAVVPAIAGRALVLTRHPAGVGGPAFHQHDPGDDAPDAVETALLPTAEGRPARRLIGSLPTLLWAVQLGAVGVDAWHSRADRPDRPDYAVLDLDPAPGVAFDVLVTLARTIRRLLRAMGRDGVAKTSGSRGIHVLVPLDADGDYAAAAALAEELAGEVVRAHPDVATTERAIGARPPGSVYVDHLQNARGKTLAAPFCARARPAATVSTPLSWAQVRQGLDPQRFTIETVPGQLAAIRQRWREAWRTAAPRGTWRPT